MVATVVTACRADRARMLFPGNVYNRGAAMPERLEADAPQDPTTRKAVSPVTR